MCLNLFVQSNRIVGADHIRRQLAGQLMNSCGGRAIKLKAQKRRYSFAQVVAPAFDLAARDNLFYPSQQREKYTNVRTCVLVCVNINKFKMHARRDGN
jgi:hypothetical protein